MRRLEIVAECPPQWLIPGCGMREKGGRVGGESGGREGGGGGGGEIENEVQWRLLHKLILPVSSFC